MKFTKQAEYAVILASELAICQGQSISLKMVADKAQISYVFLRKVAFLLQKSGLIKGEEGKYGGYRLSKQAEEITLQEVLLAAGEPLWDEPCCDGGKICRTSAVCPKNSVLKNLALVICETLGSITLDIIANGKLACAGIFKLGKDNL